MMKSLRAARALSRVQLGELSAARQASEGGVALALGTLATLTALTDPQKRPPQPSEQFQLDTDEFLVCLRKSRRGVAAGPSGMTLDHLFLLLESEADSQLFAQVVVVCRQCPRTYGKVQVHQNPLSSKTTFIKNHFHQKPLSSKTIFIKNHFHQKPISSKTNFIIKNHFHQKPISSKTNFIRALPVRGTHHPSKNNILCVKA